MNSPVLSFELSQQLVVAALQAAEVISVPIAIAIVDKGGHLMAFVRQDSVTYIAYDISRRKAITALNFNAPTQFLMNIANADAAMASEMNKNPDLTMVPGGLPIQIDGICVGGLGISGGRSEQDQEIAQKAIASVSI